MAKVTLSSIASGFASAVKLNLNFTRISNAIDNALSRDGTTPNHMLAPIDMNGQRIINVGEPLNATDAVRLQDLDGLGGGGGGGDGPVAWTSITGKPTTFAPSAHTQDWSTITGKPSTYTPEAHNQDWTTITGKPTTFAPSSHTHTASDITNFNAAVTAVPGFGGGGGGGSGTTYDGFVALKDYGSVEDGVTDDKTAIDAALADSNAKVIWIGDNVYTTNTIASLAGKRFVGPGKITLAVASKKLPSNWTSIQSLPTQGSGADTNYFHSGDNSKVDTQYFRLGDASGTNFRQNLSMPITGGGFPYFESTTTPHFWTLQNYVGWSGINCRSTTVISAGVTTSVTINNASHGISTGDTVGFVYTDGTLTETKVVTVSGSTLSWTGTLTKTYPANTAITKGFRTMNPLSYYQMSHRGGGDAYANVARADCSYVPLASQTHVYETATVGLYGGDIALATDGVYGTGIEIQISDQGTDVMAVGDVRSYVRTNDTGARGAGWVGSFNQSTGSKPINAFWTCAGKSDVGIDLVPLVSTNNIAIQMGADHRFYYDASSDQTLTAKMGNTTYNSIYGNKAGTSYMHLKQTGGLDSRGRRVEWVINGVTTTAGYGSFNIRGADVEFHKPLKGYRSNGTAAFSFEPATTQLFFVDATGADTSVSISRVNDDLVLNTHGSNVVKNASGFHVPSNSLLGLSGATSYTGFVFNGTTIELYKNASLVASW